jgi:hypothetical protein
MLGAAQISVRGKWVNFPAIEVKGKTIVVTGRWLTAAAVQGEEWLESELEDPESCVQLLKTERQNGLKADLLVFRQKAPDLDPRYGYPMERESIAVAHIPSFTGWWERLPQETRKNVRRAQKRGVLVKLAAYDDELVRGIHSINNDSPVRQGRHFPHYGKSLDEVRKDHSSFLDRSDFLGAYIGEELAGFLKIVYRGEIASVMQLLVRSTHYDKRPANALIAKAVELCAEKRIRYLTYGKFHYGNKRNSSLADFKERHGFEELLIPRYYVPLTQWGAFCTNRGLHRGLLGILPAGFIAAGLKARKSWYDAKKLISRCSSMAERPNSNRLTERSIPPAGSKIVSADGPKVVRPSE